MLGKLLGAACIVGCLFTNSYAAIKKVDDELPIEDLQLFTTVLEHIKNYYVNATEDPLLFESAIRGMLTGLDPHSSYLDQNEFAELKAITTGKFGGLGVEVTPEDGFIRVISPIDDTPAQRAGIEAGDLIIKLNNVATKGISLRQAVDLMRGKPGTAIELTVIRKTEAQPFVVKIVRDIINVQSVRHEILENQFAYIRISQFQMDSGDELVRQIRAINRTLQNKVKGVILDLRNNPGGEIEATIQIADAFLSREGLKHDGMIVYAKGRMASSQIKEFAKGKDLVNGAPMVVLVNGGSASASEIVAGALQDHKRAIVLGTRSFGKGSVQTILPLRGKRGLKLTTALYYTPAGRSIQATGIMPDIIVDNLTIPQLPKEPIASILLKESDLQGHLQEGNSAQRAKDKSSTNVPLLHKDYQLYQALLVLKGLQVIVPKTR